MSSRRYHSQTEICDFEDLKIIFKNTIKINSPVLDLSNVQFKINFQYKHLIDLLKNSSIKYLYLNEDQVPHNDVIAIIKSTEIKHITFSSYIDDLKPVFIELARLNLIAHLNLSRNYLNDGLIKILANGLKQSKITQLSLSDSYYLGDNDNRDGCKILFDCLKDSQLVKLNLNKLNLTNASLKYLIGQLKDSKIQDLNISFQNNLKNMIKELADVLKYTSITHLDVEACSIGPDQMNLLAQGLKDSPVIYLQIGFNHIGTEGCKYLGDILEHSKIMELIIYNNYVDDNGVISLTKNLRKSNVKKINLLNNEIKDDGVKMLIENINGSKLEYLNLENNLLTHVGVFLLYKFTILKDVYLKLDISNFYSNNHYKYTKFFRDIYNFIIFYRLEEKLPMKKKLNLTLDELECDLVCDHVIDHIDGLKCFNVTRFTVHCDTKRLDKILIDKLFQINFSELILRYVSFESENEFKYFIDALKNLNFYSLEISGYEIKNKHAKILADNLKYLSIKKLTFDDCQIGDEGILAIGNALKDSKIIDIFLPDNNKYSKAIMDDLKKTGITERFFFRKARNLVQCFDKKSKMKNNNELVEYFKAYEIYEKNDNLWKDIENPRFVKKAIKVKRNEYFFEMIDVVGNKKKTFFDKIPHELTELIANYLTLNDIFRI